MRNNKYPQSRVQLALFGLLALVIISWAARQFF